MKKWIAMIMIMAAAITSSVAHWHHRTAVEMDFITAQTFTNAATAPLRITALQCYWNASATCTVTVERVRTFVPVTYGSSFVVTNVIKSQAVSGATSLFLDKTCFDSIAFEKDDIIRVSDNSGAAVTNYTIMSLEVDSRE